MNYFILIFLVPLLSMDPHTHDTPFIVNLGDSDPDDSSESEEIEPIAHFLETRIVVPDRAQRRPVFADTIEADLKCIIASVAGAVIMLGVVLAVYFLTN